MRKFILADKTAMSAYPTTIPLTKGQVCFAAIDTGAGTNNSGTVIDTDGSKIKDMGYILFNNNGIPQNIPIYKNKFSYVKSTYSAGTKFSATVTIPAPTASMEYTIILVKKGMGFNKRNKWTATYLAKSNDSANTMAAYFRKYFSDNAAELDIKVSGSAAQLIINGNNARQDYEIIFADEMAGTSVTPTHAIAPVNDAEAIKNMWIESAGDMGYVDTFDDFLYRGNYPLNPLRASDTTDVGFIVYTLKFAEPRQSRTIDTEINQIVQIALPTGTGVTEIEAVLKALSA